MNRLDVIKMIGDMLTQIDIARGSLLPDDPNRQKLDDLRILLDDRQRQLSKATFDDTTPEFQAAAQNLKQINTLIQNTITQVNKIVTVLANVEEFLNAVTSLMTTIAAFA